MATTIPVSPAPRRKHSRNRRRWVVMPSLDQPDGVSHGLVGALALSLVGIVFVMGLVMLAGGINGVTMVALIVAPIVIFWLSRRARRARRTNRRGMRDGRD